MVAWFLFLALAFADEGPEPLNHVPLGQEATVVGPSVYMSEATFRRYAIYRRQAAYCQAEVDEAYAERDEANQRVLAVQDAFFDGQGKWQKSLTELQAKSDKRAKRNFRNGLIIGAGSIVAAGVGGLALARGL